MNGDYVLGNIPIVRADRGQCPICGHPTGDCAGDAEPPSVVFGFGLWKSDSTDKNRSGVVVKEDIYEMRRINPFYETRILVAKQGQTISLAEAERLGIV